MGTLIKRLLGIMGCAMVLTAVVLSGTNGSANAAVITIYTDEAAFLAASTATLIDFEGIVADNGFLAADPFVIGGVAFDQIGGGQTAICGKSLRGGNPFDCALMVPANGKPLAINLTGAGSGFTAAGGIFGDTNSAGSAATPKLFGAGNVLLDTQTIPVGDMGQGLVYTFFGWTISGDENTRIEYDMVGLFEALDDLRFGAAGAAVPEPAALAMFGLGLAGLGFPRWRKMV